MQPDIEKKRSYFELVFSSYYSNTLKNTLHNLPSLIARLTVFSEQHIFFEPKFNCI